MTSRKCLLIICIFLLFLSVIFLSLHLSKISPQQKNKLYYLPSLEYLKLTGGTFKPLFADLLFIKGVLELSEKVPERTSYFLKLFGTCVNLDPKLINAYFLGGVVVPQKKEDIALGAKFLKEGMRLNPSEWRIPFWIGFDYLELGAYSKVVEYYKIASNLPDSPSYLKTNLAFLYYKANRARKGLLYLEGLQRSLKDKRLLKIMEKKIEWLKTIVFLETKITEFKRLFGKWPSDLEDLLKTGLIDRIPPDFFGKGYYLEEDLFGGSPKVRSKF